MKYLLSFGLILIFHWLVRAASSTSYSTSPVRMELTCACPRLRTGGAAAFSRICIRHSWLWNRKMGSRKQAEWAVGAKEERMSVVAVHITVISLEHQQQFAEWKVLNSDIVQFKLKINTFSFDLKLQKIIMELGKKTASLISQIATWSSSLLVTAVGNWFISEFIWCMELEIINFSIYR